MHSKYVIIAPTEGEASLIDRNIFNEVRVCGAGIPFFTLNYTSFIPEIIQHNLTPILIGIAGALDKNLSIGAVVNVIVDRFADLGAWSADGQMIGFDDLPFRKNLDPINRFESPSLLPNHPSVTGATVNACGGNLSIIQSVYGNNMAQIETMEGAAFMMVNKQFSIQGHHIRSISNHVTNRDINQWNIPLAIENLSQTLNSLIC